MIDKLLDIFGVHQTGMVIGIASNIIKAFETEYAQDHEAKLAAIDSIISVLQKHRDKISSPAPTDSEPKAA